MLVKCSRKFKNTKNENFYNRNFRNNVPEFESFLKNNFAECSKTLQNFPNISSKFVALISRVGVP